MKGADKGVIVDRYESRLNELGPVPEALGWLKGRQLYRFEFLRQIEGFGERDSVLDVGCAFGDLEPYLRSTGWGGDYCGIDIVPKLIEAGKEKNPGLDLRVLDIQQESLGQEYDWVFSSGALTSKCDEVDSYEHIFEMLTILFGQCRKGVAVNLLSPLVDFESDVNFHPEFAQVLDHVSKLSRRFSVRHDYMPYEFTVYIYKDDAVFAEGNVFEAYKSLYQKLRNDK